MIQILIKIYRNDENVVAEQAKEGSLSSYSGLTQNKCKKLQFINTLLTATDRKPQKS